MANVSRASRLAQEQFAQEQQNIWENLKAAIAASSGFKLWEEEQVSNEPVPANLDERVNSYLRETLEALAY